LTIYIEDLFHFQVKNGFTTLIDTKMRVILTNTNCIKEPQNIVTVKPSPIYWRIYKCSKHSI